MVSSEDVKKLRELTGQAMMACKAALKEAGGNLKSAVELLKKRGAQVSEKKAARTTKAGLIDAYIHAGGLSGALVELLCETDFVARAQEFRELAHDIAMQVVAVNPRDLKELLESSFIKNESETVKEHIEAAVAQIGENITIGNFSRFEL